MKKLVIYFLILVILVSSVYSSVFATISMKGLGFVNPEAAEAVNTVICASNPLMCAQGKVVGQITGEVFEEIQDANPEAAEAISTYNEIQGYIDTGAEIINELKVDQDGNVQEGTIQFSESKNENVGNIIGPDLEKEDINVRNIHLDKKDGISTLTFTGDNSNAKVKDSQFTNIRKKDYNTDAYIKLNEDGDVTEADITSNEKGATFRLGDKTVNVGPNTRVTYDGDIVQVHGKGEQTDFNLDNKHDIIIKGDNEILTIRDNKITGAEFTVDGFDVEYAGPSGGKSTVIITDKGYEFSENTNIGWDAQKLDIKTYDDKFLIKDNCDPVSGMSYLGVCGDKLVVDTKKDESMSLSFRNGNKFANNPVSPKSKLSYDIKGSKLDIKNNIVNIDTKQAGIVNEHNGEYSFNYENGNVVMTSNSMVKYDLKSYNLITNYGTTNIENSINRVTVSSDCGKRRCSQISFNKGSNDQADMNEVLSFTESNKGVKPNYCAQVVKNTIGPSLSKDINFKGDAWVLADNLKETGAREINLGRIMDGKPQNINDAQIGDIIFLNNPSSSVINDKRYQSLFQGMEKNEISTHVSIVIDKSPDGNPILFHQLGSKYYVESVDVLMDRHWNVANPKPIYITDIVRHPELNKQVTNMINGKESTYNDSPLLQYIKK